MNLVHSGGLDPAQLAVLQAPRHKPFHRRAPPTGRTTLRWPHRARIQDLADPNSTPQRHDIFQRQGKGRISLRTPGYYDPNGVRKHKTNRYRSLSFLHELASDIVNRSYMVSIHGVPQAKAVREECSSQ